ncbi:hypothetical protein HK099_004905 [Clydaea vesicula]|uniref:DNA replication complex GINS protein SLD5 n=1 Tax=Clydaea vesicula TaxID=447962 RepID=A0AAD5TZP0_9FUNG|nr:hypothetical protein HK099_004905 [Clydaea vesicula]
MFGEELENTHLSSICNTADVDGSNGFNTQDFLNDDSEGASEQSDIDLFTKAWINEKNSPEILNFKKELLESLSLKLTTQKHFIEEENLEIFLSSIYLQEIERLKFLIRSYLKMRLEKIEKFSLDFLVNQENRLKLSSKELSYCEKYQRLKQEYFNKTCLEKLPEMLRSIEEKNEMGLSMIVEPDLNDSVLFKVDKSIEIYRLEDRLVTIKS